MSWLSGGSALRLVGRGVAAFGVVLAVMATRVVTSARDELHNADSLRGHGDVDGAIVHYRRAARWYAPGSPYHVAALDRLAEVAQSARARGDTAQALSAARGIRAAILGARSFYTPERERLQRANALIAELMAGEAPPPVDAGKTKAVIRSEHLAMLTVERGPRIGWTLLLLTGFAAWVAGAFLFVGRALDAENRIVAGEARVWGTVVVVGFGLFVLGMALA